MVEEQNINKLLPPKRTLASQNGSKTEWPSIIDLCIPLTSGPTISSSNVNFPGTELIPGSEWKTSYVFVKICSMQCLYLSSPGHSVSEAYRDKNIIFPPPAITLPSELGCYSHWQIPTCSPVSTSVRRWDQCKHGGNKREVLQFS